MRKVLVAAAHALLAGPAGAGNRVTESAEREPPATPFELPNGYERRLALGGRSQSSPAERSPR